MKCTEVVEYKKLLPSEFKARLSARPLAYIPIGSLEWHGEHMCLGNDSVKVESICKLAACKDGGIVLPALFTGIQGMTGFDPKYKLGGDGIFCVPEKLLWDLITAQMENLDKIGFKGAIVITGHYPEEQVQLAVKVAQAFKGANGMKALGMTDRDIGRGAGHTGDHAAKWETSILMALHPELVDLSQLPASGPLNGVYGDDPRTTASAHLGRKVVDSMVDDICALARKLVP